METQPKKLTRPFESEEKKAQRKETKRLRIERQGIKSVWKTPRISKWKAKHGFVKKIPRRSIKVTASQRAVFRMFLATQGLKSRKSKGGTVYEDGVFKYMNEPAERYELHGDKIIRTVDTFHYLTKHTTKDGKCNSFERIQMKFLVTEPLHGKELVTGIHDVVWLAFNHRYHVGRLIHYNSKGSDLSTPIKWISIIIAKHTYFIVQLQKEDGSYTGWELFKSKNLIFRLNPTVPLKMTQEQIIENLRNGKIKTVNEYGNPNKTYSPEEVLKILGLD